MIPGKFNLTGGRAIYQGDTYTAIASITLPPMSEWGGPTDLTSATVSAQVRDEEQELLGTFDVEILDPEAGSVIDPETGDVRATAGIVKPTMASVDTAALPLTDDFRKAYWDLQVQEGSWVGTVLRGPVAVLRQETQ